MQRLIDATQRLYGGNISNGYSPRYPINAWAIALANLVVANLVGSGIPILLDRLGKDPALASNIFMTMVTDLVGFGGFLAIATVLL